jgi:DNA replication and repair protein RecF
MKIKTLQLHNFRNLSEMALSLSDAPIVVLYGENGAGKTSILEAISLLTPGRGLHRHKLDSHIQHNSKEWTIFAEVEADNNHTIGMQFKSGKRILKIDDEKNKSQSALSNLGNILWFTPKMDRLFMDSTSARREFLDRLVFGHFKDHASHLNRYKTHLKNRLKLLKEHGSDDWISIEEEQAALFAEKITTARHTYLENLQPYLSDLTLKLIGSFERLDILNQQSIQVGFKNSRIRDQKTHSSLFGPHRSDITGQLTEQEINLSDSSTGQHKKAILEILLANARLTHAKSGFAPIILLDEVAGHLDQKTKEYFLKEITELGSQVWLTGTEKDVFKTLKKAQFIHIQQGIAQP